MDSDLPAPARPALGRIALQVAVTGIAVAWLATAVDVDALLESLAALPLGILLVAAGWIGLALLGGVVRWQLLLGAYGASRVPSYGWALRVYLVGTFFNTYVPGGVAGEAYRGLAVREAFGGDNSSAAVRGVVVSFVERACGLAGLMLLVSLAISFHPIPGLESVRPAAMIGVAATTAGCGLLGSIHRVAGRLPTALAGPLALAPPLVRPLSFVGAIALSVATQAATAIAGHLLVAHLAPEVTLAESLVVVPTALATQFLPISIGGLGVREAAFVALYGRLGVDVADALAGSLGMFAILLVFGAIGGLLALTPRKRL